MKTLRCSKLPLLIACNASVLADAVPADEAQSAEAGQGNELHGIVGQFAVTGVAPDYEAIVDDEVRRLVRNAVGMVEKIPHTGLWLSEEAVRCPIGPEWELSGHIDLVNSGGRPAIIDVKAGRRHDTDSRAQVRGYALCVDDGIVGMDCWLLYASDNTAENWYETPGSMAAFREEILSRLAAPIAYTPGPHCEAHYCPLRHNCPARADQTNTLAVALLADPELRAITGVPAELLPAFYSKLSTVAAAVERAKDIIKKHVQFAGGRIEGDGYALAIGKDTYTEDIDAAAAWELLTANLTIDELAAVVKVVKGDVVKVIRAKAPKGTMQKAEDAFIQALRDAGAILRKPRAGAIRLEKITIKEALSDK